MNRTSDINPDWLVFTDLDGTLLDAQTYSFSVAVAALNFLAQKKIPVIPCTSKTQIEVSEICKKMKLDSPFIVENGSALIIPENYFTQLPADVKKKEQYLILILGKAYPDILHFFEILRSKFNLQAKGFYEMDLAEIRVRTGLDETGAHLAKERGYSEPFVLKNLENLPTNILGFARENGFKILKGNRFYHLLGNTDKGNALNALQVIYEQNTGKKAATIGIGDSPNDLEMLKEVDRPVLVKKPDGCYAPDMHIDSSLRTVGIGPAGWQEAIFKIIE